MVDHERWQLDGSAPELYQRYLVPAITSLWAAELVEQARPRPDQAVLDVACGTGVVTHLAAQKMARGRLVGLDFNGRMLAIARSLPTTSMSIEWVEASALDLPFPNGCFGLTLCQLGLQFFPDQPRALREMKGVLAASGRIVLSVHSAIERTPGAHAFTSALDDCLGPNAASIKRCRAYLFWRRRSQDFAFRSRVRTDQRLYSDENDHVPIGSRLRSVSFGGHAPMAGLLQDRGIDERESPIRAVADRTRSNLDPDFLRDGRFSFPQESLVARARKFH